MNGYTETGYIVAVGSLSIYGLTLLRREQLSRRRLSRHGVNVGARHGTVGVSSPEKATGAETASSHEEPAQS